MYGKKPCENAWRGSLQQQMASLPPPVSITLFKTPRQQHHREHWSTSTPCAGQLSSFTSAWFPTSGRAADVIDWFKEFGVSTKIRFDEYKVSSNSMECCIKLTRIPMKRPFYSCSVPWPLNRSEAGGDLVLLQTFLLFMSKSWYSNANKPVNMIIYDWKTRSFVIKEGRCQPLPVQRPGHWAHNSKMVCSNLWWIMNSLIFQWIQSSIV